MERKLDMDVKEQERHPMFTFRKEQHFYFSLPVTSIEKIKRLLLVAESRIEFDRYIVFNVFHKLQSGHIYLLLRFLKTWNKITKIKNLYTIHIMNI